MGRETGFLEYNITNILQNLLQAEDHLRVLYGKDSDEEGHNSCVSKHLMIVSGEASEAVSHSSHINPGKTPVFRRIMADATSLRNRINDLSVQDAIVKVREIRKEAEKLDSRYDTSRCKACSLDGGTWSDRQKDLNTPLINNNARTGVNEMKMSELTKQLLAINGGQFVGRAVSDVAAPYLDTIVTPGAQLPYRASTWLNVAGGIAIQLVGHKYLKGSAQLGAVIVGSHMLSKVVNYAMEASVGGSAASVTRMSVRPITPVSSVGGGFSQVAGF